jgi:hypothetical protein
MRRTHQPWSAFKLINRGRQENQLLSRGQYRDQLFNRGQHIDQLFKRGQHENQLFNRGQQGYQLFNRGQHGYQLFSRKQQGYQLFNRGQQGNELFSRGQLEIISLRRGIHGCDTSKELLAGKTENRGLVNLHSGRAVRSSFRYCLLYSIHGMSKSPYKTGYRSNEIFVHFI